MSIGFRVYIDESGDEGFKFDQPGKGSSRWFVLSAAVMRLVNDREVMELVDRVRALLNKPPREALHFRKLKHEHRLPYVNEIAKAKVRLVNVMVHKPSIREPEKFASEAHLLYRYATRYLLERVSWLCRDRRHRADDVAELIFSNRSCMSYDALREYLRRLKNRTNEFDVRIDWSALDPERIEAQTHDSRAGLQVADAVASSFYMACELTPQGFNESRYAQMLQPVLYRHDRECIGYGMKFWPREANECTEQYLSWLRSL
ncbi:MAG: DUF3800 domain-containing protein [Phycisphaerae bacterium]|nr:DUF3800 domain-containing protein [Phycisphaerae bacterium]